MTAGHLGAGTVSSLVVVLRHLARSRIVAVFTLGLWYNWRKGWKIYFSGAARAMPCKSVSGWMTLSMTWTKGNYLRTPFLDETYSRMLCFLDSIIRCARWWSHGSTGSILHEICFMNVLEGRLLINLHKILSLENIKEMFNIFAGMWSL